MKDIAELISLDKGESPTNLADCALDQARRGRRVIRLGAGSKAAIDTGWPEKATTDPEKVRALWWDPVMGAYQPYNVGIATGGGIVVLDIDVKNGVNGKAALVALELTHGDLPQTYTVETPSGGRHDYFTTSKPIGCPKPRPGVDIKGERGYVVAAGSVTTAGRYRCTNDVPLTPLPEAWEDYLFGLSAGPKGVCESRVAPAPTYDLEAAFRRAITYLQRAKPAVEGDGGDRWTFSVAAQCRNLGVATPREVCELMLDHWNDRCSPPWSPEDLLVKCENAFKHSQQGTGAKAPEAEFERVDRQTRTGADDDEIAVGEPPSDLGNARRLVRTQGEDMRFVHAWGSWLCWDGSHWRRDEDGAAMRLAKAAVESMHADAGKINDEARRTATRKHALASQSAARLSAMLSLAESEPEVLLKASEIDADPMLLGVPNGVVDLRTGEFREARRSDHITKIAGAKFDPAARCPNWRAFLRAILPDDQIVQYLQRACGYVLTGLTGEEVLFVLLGEGLNGKSTFRETLFEMMGDYAVGSDASLLVTSKRSGGATPDLVRLLGRRFVAINETEKDDVLNEARVKYITSHDKITARNLYESFFDFTPTHKTFLTTNHKPIVKDGGEGTWRRIHLLPFLKKIEKPDPGFRERKLIPELPGILNWAIEGALAYQRGGLAPPQAVLNATDEYRDDMDLVGQWISERCEVDPGAATPTAGLHADYETWARTEVGFTMSTVGLGRALVARGFASVRSGGSRRIKGIRLKSPPGRDFAAAAGATGWGGTDGTDKEAFCANFMD